MIVVKLGGSLFESGRHRSVLAILARAKEPVVVVPGGGAFADAVRAAQARLAFPDRVAHRMAILAMHQMAEVLAALQPRLTQVETLNAMRAAAAAGTIPVWLPLKLCARDRRIPLDWSITSDGLAARLAERLGRAPLIVVKSCAIDPRASARELAAAGIVDAAFTEIVERARLDWRIFGAGDDDRFAAGLRSVGASKANRRSAPAVLSREANGRG